jgi:hypothetical protein
MKHAPFVVICLVVAAPLSGQKAQRMLLDPGTYPIGSSTLSIAARCVDRSKPTPRKRTRFAFGTASIRVRAGSGDDATELPLHAAVTKRWIDVRGTDDHSSIGVRAPRHRGICLVVGEDAVVGQSKRDIRHAASRLARPMVVTARRKYRRLREHYKKHSERPDIASVLHSVDQEVAWRLFDAVIRLDDFTKLLREHAGKPTKIDLDPAYRDIFALRHGRPLTEAELAELRDLAKAVHPATGALDRAVRIAQAGTHWEITTTRSRRVFADAKFTRSTIRKAIGKRQPVILDSPLDGPTALHLTTAGIHFVCTLRAGLALDPRVRPTTFLPLFLAAEDPVTNKRLYPYHTNEEVCAATGRARALGIRVESEPIDIRKALAGLSPGRRGIVICGQQVNGLPDLDSVQCDATVRGSRRFECKPLSLMSVVEAFQDTEADPPRTRYEEFVRRTPKLLAGLSKRYPKKIAIGLGLVSPDSPRLVWMPVLVDRGYVNRVAARR